MGIQAGGWGVGALFLSLCPFEKDKNMADGQHSLGLCALISYLNTKRPKRQTENDESTGVVYFSCVCVRERVMFADYIRPSIVIPGLACLPPSHTWRDTVVVLWTGVLVFG